MTIGVMTLLFLGGPLMANAVAQGTTTPPPADTGSTAFMLISAALVLLMTPGLAFFMEDLCDRATFSTR